MWMDLRGVMLSEVRERQILYDFTDREREQTDGRQWGGAGGGRGGKYSQCLSIWVPVVPGWVH